MRRQRAVILAVVSGCLVVFLALGLALLLPGCAPLPQYP
jgi:hypothetical protein